MTQNEKLLKLINPCKRFLYTKYGSRAYFLQGNRIK